MAHPPSPRGAETAHLTNEIEQGFRRKSTQSSSASVAYICGSEHAICYAGFFFALIWANECRGGGGHGHQRGGIVMPVVAVCSPATRRALTLSQ